MTMVDPLLRMDSGELAKSELRGRAGFTRGHMKIEVLYFEGCPHLAPTLSLVHEVLGELGLASEVREVEVRTPEDAERLLFLGSPSVRVDEMDVEPGAESRTEYALSCRLYGGSGFPPKELLAAALEARRSEREIR
jgi:hypothetical protein